MFVSNLHKKCEWQSKIIINDQNTTWQDNKACYREKKYSETDARHKQVKQDALGERKELDALWFVSWILLFCKYF